MGSQEPSGGLSQQEAAARLKADGLNALPEPDRRNIVRIVGDTLREPMFALLLAAAAIYFALGDLKEAALLGLFATASVSIAIVQEIRSERVLRTLRDLTSPRALVIRDGVAQRVAGTEIVRGDLVVLAEGDRVPADAVVVSGHDIYCDESLLTGEAAPVQKRAAAGVPQQGRPGGDDLPFVYSGTLVVRGHGRAEVIATGERSEIGKIGRAITRIEPEPPRLQAETRRLVRNFAALSLTLTIVVTVLYGVMRADWLAALLGGIALGMSMLPEEFPLVLAVFMVMGAWRISRARVLTRRIAAIETLGAATVLCTDKTGTLTQNRMTVVALRTATGEWRSDNGGAPAPEYAAVARYALLACAVEPFDPMEKAFYAFAERLPEQPARPESRLEWTYELRPDLLAVTNVWRDGDDRALTVATKGAPEAIADLCGFSEPERAVLRRNVDEMAGNGMRVLGVARAVLDAGAARPESPRAFRFEFLGLVGLADPLRPAVPAAIEECRAAGVRILMITGDYPQTALAIARQAGLPAGEVVSGPELAAMSDPELAARLREGAVFARTLPEQKLRIVQVLKANGEVVAMTGDGVNDAPSLKAAHIGIAMGGRGTDVAREAASLVLLDDDFASIALAIRLGRRIYDNLRKAMAYILAIHVPIAGLALLPLVFGLPIVLWPLHIAFLEIVIDPVCSIAFEAEAEEANTMRRPPRNPYESLFGTAEIVWSLFQGAVALAVAAGVYVFALGRGLPEADARSLTFTALVATNLGLILVNRSRGTSLATALGRRNPALWALIGATSAILAAVMSSGAARELFHFGPLHADDLALALLCGAVTLVALNWAKRVLPLRELR